MEHYLSMTAMAVGLPAPRSQPPLTMFIQDRALSHHLFWRGSRGLHLRRVIGSCSTSGTKLVLRSRRLERAAYVESIFNFISREMVMSL